MTELRDHLRRSDPLTCEPLLDADAVRMMRQRVIAEASRTRPGLASHVVLVFCAAAVLAISLGTVVHLSGHQHTRNGLAAVTDDLDRGRDLRRVYFDTPSGIHVVWLFESE